MATQNINIVISSTGGVTVIRNIQQIGQAAQNAVSPLALLQRQIQAVMATLAVRQIAEWADEWTAAANKVSVFSKSQSETNEILDRLYNIASKLGVPLNGVVDLYHKLSIQSKALGVSTNENIQFTENVSKALAIQGTSAASAKGALLQLSQAMGTGKVKAQEYNSLLTGMPLLLKVAAENIDKAGGSIAKLTAMQRAGELTSRMLFDAISKGTEKFDEIFNKMDKTFAQGMNTLVDGLIRFFGEMNKSLGISNLFFKAIQFIVANLDTMVKLLAVVGVAAVAAFAPAIISAFAAALVTAAGALASVTALLLANPFVAIAAAVAAVIAFGDSWNAGIDNITTVKDLLRAAVEVGMEAFNEFVTFLATVWSSLTAGAQAAYDAITGTVTGATGGWFTSYSTFFNDVGDGFIGLLRAIARVMDAIGGLILGAVLGMMRAFAGLPGVVSNIFADVYNAIAGWIEKAINITIEGLNRIRSSIGADLLQSVHFQQLTVQKGMLSKYGEGVMKAIDDGFDIQGNFLEKKIVGFAQRAQEIARNRASRRTLNPQGMNDHTDPEKIAEKAKKQKKETEKKDPLPDQLRVLLDRIYPAAGALLELAKAHDILDRAQAAGLITGEEYNKFLALAELHYRDIINPLGAVNRELDIEAGFIAMNTRQREIEQTVYQKTQELLKKGEILTDREIQGIRDRVTANQQLTIAMQAQNALLDDSVNKRRGFIEQLDAINALLADPNSKFTKADATEALMKSQPDLFAGTQEAIDLNTARYQKMYDDIALMEGNSLITHDTALQMRMKADAKYTEQNLEFTSKFFSDLSGLSSSSNKKLAAIGKAAAITEATIKGFVAVQNALAAAPPPYSYALAAAAGVAAAANVAKIVSTPTGFAVGGDFKVGGSGGVDSQMVAFRASPGEQVSVSTPTQVRKGSGTKGQGSSAPQVTFNPRIINLIDPAMVGDYLQTGEGQQVLINTIRQNADSVRQAVTNG